MRHEPGTLLYDPATDKVGEYQDRSGPYAMLRPVGGGREWQADPAALRPATAQERLSAGVRAANQRARTDAPFLVGIGAPRPPVPTPDCAECVDLAVRRAEARATHDYSAETDANVLLRSHQRREHRE
ncbi:hypothetical protein [Streptomyces sp. NPDC050121]|uniref:hypothetical protein n=1 Tax=Streptomyces sp. NPDC050121 TaxID=3365601 RepID=UPI0037A17D32